ncbi:LysR family transcriptional regulator [Saccharopolyspora sp. NPDC002376]
MDLDLAQVRAFVAAARRLHFGRAAEQLFISQQALSKRISRLENQLGTRLFDRGRSAVGLTEAGLRFLEPAQQTLAAADFAVAEARREERSLRLDVWGHLYAPTRTIGLVIESAGLRVELGRSRDLTAATKALTLGEIDAGFGRAHQLGKDFEHQVVRLEPVDAIVSSRHPLADRTELRPADLRESTLWCPAALDRLDFLDRFAAEFALTAEPAGVNLGLDHFLDRVRAEPDHVAILPNGVATPESVRRIRLVRPTPLYAWSLVGRRGNRDRLLGALRRACTDIAAERDWLNYDPAQHWLPH